MRVSPSLGARMTQDDLVGLSPLTAFNELTRMSTRLREIETKIASKRWFDQRTRDKLAVAWLALDRALDAAIKHKVHPRD